MEKKNKKDAVFSVSMKTDEVGEIEEYINNLETQLGFTISRNELIRRATLAHIRFTQKNDESLEYKEIFKRVGK